MSLIRDYLLEEGVVKDEHILLYHGGLNQVERKQVLEASKASTETTVMLIQLQAGGVGLNLQEYDRVIFVSPWWTSALMDQAIARAVRMGQTKVVHVYHLHLQAEQDGTINIDTMVDAKAGEKRIMLKKLFEWCM
jgi:SNF2 family DNA or RNA helicase